MVGLLIILLIGALYFLPSFVGQSKRNAGAIFTLNLLLGWTIIGWVVAMTWAMTVDPETTEDNEDDDEEDEDEELVRQPADIRFCPSCGVKLMTDSRFCAKCGRQLNT